MRVYGTVVINRTHLEVRGRADGLQVPGNDLYRCELLQEETDYWIWRLPSQITENALSEV